MSGLMGEGVDGALTHTTYWDVIGLGLARQQALLAALGQADVR